MDFRQSTTKRSFDVMELQKQENMASTSHEIGDSFKNTKQVVPELDPLKMPDILEKVFSHLDTDSIKNARLVNPVWRVEGTKILMTKCYIKIPRNLTTKDLYSSEMNEFKEFLSLKSSDRSMIPNITLGDFDVWNWLGVLGPQVKTVKLDNMYPEAKLLLKLFDFLPNLKYLNFQPSLYDDKILPILKSVMSKMEKIETELVISSIIFNVDNAVKLTEFEDFTNCTNIKIEKLQVILSHHFPNSAPDLMVRLVNMMNKLLSTNQNTLKRLTLNNCHLLLSFLEFPCMTALTQINLEFYPCLPGQPHHCKFQTSFRFSENVPNLQEFCVSDKVTSNFSPSQGFFHVALGIMGPTPVQGFFQHLFENNASAPSVKRVEYLYDHTSLDVEFLFKMFPNVEDLQMSVNRRPMWFSSLWTLGTNLRKLHLVFNKVDHNVNLDSIFTGFTPCAAEWIKLDPNLAPYSLEKLDELKVQQSILNLKELEQITIDLVYSSSNREYIIQTNLNRNNRNLNVHQPQRMLTVAEKYCLRLLPKNPQLTVNVVEGRNGLWRANAAMEALEEVSRLANVTVKRI